MNGREPGENAPGSFPQFFFNLSGPLPPPHTHSSPPPGHGALNRPLQPLLGLGGLLQGEVALRRRASQPKSRQKCRGVGGTGFDIRAGGGGSVLPSSQGGTPSKRQAENFHQKKTSPDCPLGHTFGKILSHKIFRCGREYLTFWGGVPGTPPPGSVWTPLVIQTPLTPCNQHRGGGGLLLVKTLGKRDLPPSLARDAPHPQGEPQKNRAVSKHLWSL